MLKREYSSWTQPDRRENAQHLREETPEGEDVTFPMPVCDEDHQDSENQVLPGVKSHCLVSRLS